MGAVPRVFPLSDHSGGSAPFSIAWDAASTLPDNQRFCWVFRSRMESVACSGRVFSEGRGFGRAAESRSPAEPESQPGQAPTTDGPAPAGPKHSSPNFQGRAKVRPYSKCKVRILGQRLGPRRVGQACRSAGLRLLPALDRSGPFPGRRSGRGPGPTIKSKTGAQGRRRPSRVVAWAATAGIG